MTDKNARGSSKLLDAWKNRALTEASVMEIAESLSKSPARLTEASVHGGADATGLSVTLAYDGDDIPRCGNDIQFWLGWHRRFGGVVVPPKVIIKGTPRPDFLEIRLGFGQVDVGTTGPVDLPGNVGGVGV